MNTNPETGIWYGIISANAIDPEMIDEIQRKGIDIHFETAKRELESRIRDACEDRLGYRQTQEVVELALDLFDTWEDEEPVHKFNIDGVKGQTTWLGGALLVWVFESPNIVKADLCSPCVPNCGNLDSFNSDGYECYNVPDDWRIKND